MFVELEFETEFVLHKNELVNELAELVQEEGFYSLDLIEVGTDPDGGQLLGGPSKLLVFWLLI